MSMLLIKSYDPETICQIFEKGKKVNRSWLELFFSILKNPDVKVPISCVQKCAILIFETSVLINYKEGLG